VCFCVCVFVCVLLWVFLCARFSLRVFVCLLSVNATSPRDYQGSVHRTCDDTLRIEYRDFRDRRIGSEHVFTDDSGYFCTASEYWIDYTPQNIAVFCGINLVANLPALQVLQEGKCVRR